MKLKVEKKIDRYFKNILRNGCPRSRVFLTGSNSRGVVKNFVELKDDGGGCHNMPQISGGQISKAYVELANKKLVPHAFVKINSTHKASAINYTEETNLRNHGIPFISYGRGKAGERVYIKKKSGIKQIRTSYGSKKPRAIIEKEKVRAV